MGIPAPTIYNPTLRVEGLNATSTGINTNAYPQVVGVDANGDITPIGRKTEYYYTYGTGARTGVTSTTPTVQPGVAITVIVPAGQTARVYANCNIGLLNVSTTAGNYSTVDAVIYVDGAFLPVGGWNRQTTVNHGTGNSLSVISVQASFTLTAGTHTVDLRTFRNAGNSAVTIGGNATTSVNPGEMTLIVTY